MKNDTQTNNTTNNTQSEKSATAEKTSSMSRRKFVELTATAAAGFTIVPRHVLGKGFIAPSDKITLAYIGVGTQGTRE